MGWPRLQEVAAEVAQAKPDAGEAVEEPAGADRAVVVGLGVDPRLALHDRDQAAEPGALAVHDAGEQQDERPVEREAPDLAGDALLGGQGRARRVERDPVPAPSERAAGNRDRGARGAPPTATSAYSRQGVDLAGLHGRRAQRPHERPGPRHQAGHERDEQQRREQHEPPRSEDVEEPGPVEERAPERDGRRGTAPPARACSATAAAAIRRPTRAAIISSRISAVRIERRVRQTRATDWPSEGRGGDDMGRADMLDAERESLGERGDDARELPREQQHAQPDHQRARRRRRSRCTDASPTRTRP